jgi:hypothetical protein
MTPQTSPTSASAPIPGKVILTLNRQQYGTEDPLEVTIYNGLGQTVWIEDHRSSCASVVLEHMIEGTWQPMGQCNLPGPAMPPMIPAGSSLVQHLNYAQGMDTGAGWPVGTYRVALTFALSASALASSAATTVYSPEFTIQ